MRAPRLGPGPGLRALVLALGVAVACASAAVARAEEAPCAPGPEALGCFAARMAAGQWAAAWGALCAADQAALPEAVWVQRYEGLARVPWVAAVLRSARVVEGRFEAADWTHTRFARAGVLADAAAVAALPREGYGVVLREGRVYLGDAHHREPTTAPDVAADSARVARPDADWFARYAAVSAACKRGQRFLLARLEGEGVADALALDCRATAGDEVVVWAHVPSPRYKRVELALRVLGATPVRTPHPFAAPLPTLLAHDAFPLLP